MAPNPIVTSVTWPSSPKDEGQRLKTDISYRNDGTDGEVFSRVVDSDGNVLDSLTSSVAAGEISTDSIRFYMPAHDVTIYAQVGVGTSMTSQKGPKTIKLTEAPPTPKKHTALSIGVLPTSGTLPYEVTIDAALVSGGAGLSGKTIWIIKNDAFYLSQITDSSGLVTFTDTVKAEASYYAFFAGDGIYEESKSSTKTVTGEYPPPPAEFMFDSYDPPTDTRELFSTKAVLPEITAEYDVGESVYVHYCVKNIGGGPGAGTMEVKDRDTGATIKTYDVPELPIYGRFSTSDPGAYIGKMPGKDWRLEFKVDP